MAGVGFFVCGTPSNNRGFELVELGPEKLPGSPEIYLDKPPADAAESHRVESVLIDDQRYVQYSRVLRINPNDAEANRGAYLAVGCLIRQRLAFHTVSNCVDVVSELYGRVCSGLTSDRSFPIDYRLADFTHGGAPLEERAAYPCSPLLVADVVLQALNSEGPIDWQHTKEVLLAPSEMIAGDVSRYQLYSRQGLLGSLASIDTDRAHAHETVQQTTAAAQALAELQHEWAEIEGAADRLWTKGQAFKKLALALDRNVGRDLALDSRTEPIGSSRAVLHEREHDKGPPAFRIASQRARAGRDAAVRRRHAPKQGHWLRGAGWGRTFALVLVGSVIAVLAIVAAQTFLSPELAVEPAPPQAVLEPEAQDGEQGPQQPENDVARERAALDAAPKQ